MADSILSTGDSATAHVIRCAECHELVSADRVRHREERVKVAARPAPGRWRSGGPPIFRQTASRVPTLARAGTLRPAALRPAPQALRAPQSAYEVARIPVCEDCLRRQRMGLYGISGIAALCLVAAAALYSYQEATPSSQEIALLATPAPRALQTRAPAATPAIDPAPAGPPPIWAKAAPPPPPATAPPPTPIAAAPQPQPAAPSPPASASQPPAEPATQPAAASDTPEAAAPDTADAAPAEPPIWKTERAQSSRKIAKGTTSPSASRRGPTAGNAVALRNSGYVALEQRRYGEALTYLQQATQLGDAYAPLYIGQLFESGIGVPRDVGQASYWYSIAIRRGNAVALSAFNRMRTSPY